VSSDFGKLDVMRHLTSGIDCAIAGEATAVAAAPTAETFKKSRRFIQTSPYDGGVSHILERFLRRANSMSSGALWPGALTRKLASENATMA
jgi:hypothetical protein